MKVVVVAHKMVGKQLYLVLMGFDGRVYRTVAPPYPHMIGQTITIEMEPAAHPPHTETITVTHQIPQAPVDDTAVFIAQNGGLCTGPLGQQFNRLTQKNEVQARFVSEAKGMPERSTIFWQVDRPLKRIVQGKRTRYHYPDGTRLPFVAADAKTAVAEIPAKAILCLTLAPRWQPKNQPEIEPRCYVQIAGWFAPPVIPQLPSEPPSADIDEMTADFPPDLYDDPFSAEPFFDEPPDFADLPPAFDDFELPSDSAVLIEADWRPLATGTPQETLQQVFGYDAFRTMQADVIDNVLNKQDTLVIMPTGQGKSLCYQLPALHFSGITIVVSPLISLMIDQVQQLKEIGVAAATLNSSMPRAEQSRIIGELLHGRLKLLYISPETLLRARTLQLLSQCQVDCFTVDEAHCISAWGHDFRKEYRELMQVRSRFPSAVCVALTATATQRVRQDISQTLGIPRSNQYVASFDRPNLHLSVQLLQNADRQVAQFLKAHQGEAGIVYCPTRKLVDTLTDQLEQQGYPVLPYHAGLPDGVRKQNQTRFIYEDGLIMVATVAFGMGINKPNVRWVLHFGLPKNIESYYQQIGRAGRDGLDAHCLMIFSYQDIRTIKYFISQGAEDQQRGAQMRLDALIAYAEAAVCRRRPLLDYFGEGYKKETCTDMCDNCQDTRQLVDITVMAQKFLSCVRRTGERFGMSHVIDVLRGSRSEKILSRGHDTLSTYGIGLEFSKKEWQFFGRQFQQLGLLSQDAQFGSLMLTDLGHKVMRGESLMGHMPEKQTAVEPIGRTPMPTDYDSKLYEIVHAKRGDLAREAGLPPYVVFSDRTLVDMALRFPQSRDSFAQLYGVGRAKLDKYADIFLPLIQAYCQEHGLNEVAIPKPAVMSRTGHKSRSEEVWEAYQDGESVIDLAKRYGVKNHTVLNHLWKAFQAGHPLRFDAELVEITHLSAEQQDQVLEVFAEHGTDMLKPVFSALGESVSYADLHVMRLIAISQPSN